MHCERRGSETPLLWRLLGWGGHFLSCACSLGILMRDPFNLITSLIIANALCKSTCLYNAPSLRTIDLRILSSTALIQGTILQSVNWVTRIFCDRLLRFGEWDLFVMANIDKPWLEIAQKVLTISELERKQKDGFVKGWFWQIFLYPPFRGKGTFATTTTTIGWDLVD